MISMRQTGVMSLCLLVMVIGACSSPSPRIARVPEPVKPVDLASIPNPTPRHEPESRYGNPASYEVFGRRYYTRQANHGFVEQGVASWYGPNFHGKRTSSGEPYDMYKMTAAHKSIRLPAYVEVTNLKNGRRIIVRVNDRGPFHDNRIIDLSYVAAAKLDLVRQGTGLVEIRVIDPSNPLAHRQDTRQQPVRHQARHQSREGQATRAPVSARVAAAAPSVPVTTPSQPQLEVETSAANSAPVDTQYAAPAQLPSASAQAHMPDQIQVAQNVPTPPPTAAASTAVSARDLPGDKQMFLQLGAFSDQQNAHRLQQRVQGIVNRQIAVISEEHNGRALYKVRIGPVPNVEVADNIVSRLNTAGLYDHRVVFQ